MVKEVVILPEEGKDRGNNTDRKHAHEGKGTPLPRPAETEKGRDCTAKVGPYLKKTRAAKEIGGNRLQGTDPEYSAVTQASRYTNGGLRSWKNKERAQRRLEKAERGRDGKAWNELKDTRHTQRTQKQKKKPKGACTPVRPYFSRARENENGEKRVNRGRGGRLGVSQRRGGR